MTEYRLSVSREVDARLKMKCEKLSDAFVLDDNGNCELLITYIQSYGWRIADFPWLAFLFYVLADSSFPHFLIFCFRFFIVCKSKFKFSASRKVYVHL